MSRVCRFFAFLIAACIVAGCTPLGGIGGAGASDFLLAVPASLEYELNYVFFPDRDLKVYVPSNGDLKRISLNQVTIKISKPPYTSGELKQISWDTEYKLEKKGRFIIVVEYLALTASCYIDVLSPAGSGSLGFINIEWAMPDE